MSNLREVIIHLRGRAEICLLVDVFLVLVILFLLLVYWACYQISLLRVYYLIALIRSQYAGEIWNRSYFFLRLRLPSTSDLSRKRFWNNALQTGRIKKRRLRVLVWAKNILKTGTFRKWRRQDDHVIFPDRVLLKAQMQNKQWLLRSQFFRRCMDGKRLMRFQSKRCRFKTLTRP